MIGYDKGLLSGKNLMELLKEVWVLHVLADVTNLCFSGIVHVGPETRFQAVTANHVHIWVCTLCVLYHLCIFYIIIMVFCI